MQQPRTFLKHFLPFSPQKEIRTYYCLLFSNSRAICYRQARDYHVTTNCRKLQLTIDTLRNLKKVTTPEKSGRVTLIWAIKRITIDREMNKFVES